MISVVKPALSQTDTIKIQTSAICETCKKTLEGDLSFEKGVKKSVLDLDTKILTVIYNPEKTNPEKIRIAVTKSGYDADSLHADPKAYKHLPECCKKPEIK
jgi:periplasmic mercuric ion binding protein